MAKIVAKAFHPISGEMQYVYEGFSWSTFFFGPFFFFYKAAFFPAILYLFGLLMLASFSTDGQAVGGLIAICANLIMANLANAIVANSLIKRGFVTEKEWLEKQRP